MKVISVIEKSVVLDTIFFVDFTVCTNFESNILNFSILGGRSFVPGLWTIWLQALSCSRMMPSVSLHGRLFFVLVCIFQRV